MQPASHIAPSGYNGDVCGAVLIYRVSCSVMALLDLDV